MAEAKISSDRWVLDADLEGQKEEQNFKKKGWRSTLALTYSAIGVVYGDVGTSPLYVFSSTFTENTPSETDVLGAMSIIFWTITLIVVVKYMLIVLLADDNGEGGTFALYSLICRFAGMRPANNGVPDASDVTLSHYSRHSGDKNSKSLSRRISFKLKQYLASRAGAQASLLCLVLLMTSMVLGDGVLTPAQSVLGAIYGLQVKTSVSQGTGPSGPGRGSLPAAVAGVLALVGTLAMLGWPSTGVEGPSEVTMGAAPREEGLLPAAVSGATGVPAQSRNMF